MNTIKGFTLIELLIVIVIIGITSSLAILAFGDFGQSKGLLFAIEQLENTLKMAEHQAILEHSTLGLRIDNQGYQLLKFKNSESSAPISNKSLFKIHYFPEHTWVSFPENLKTLKNSPTIIINSSGEISPFLINFGTDSEKNQFTLQCDSKGNLNLVKH